MIGLYWYWLLKLVQGVWQEPNPTRWDYLPEYPKEEPIRVKPVAHRSSS